MATENTAIEVEGMLNDLLSSFPDYYLVNIKVKPGNNIKAFLDGDKGISIEQCVKFNRQLYKAIEEKQLFAEGDFSLEVSSPGVSEPLKLKRQYTKNIGRTVEVIFNEGEAKTGTLLQATEEDIILEEITGKGKKAVTQQFVIPFNNIKSTTVQIKF